MREIPLPDIFDRQAWNAQDPLSSCYHYLFFMYTILPALFGIRMCMRCPDCSVDRTDPRNFNNVTVSCQDCMGSNMKSMGGYAGLATGMAFATEYQGEATPHGHGFVSLANMYQHHNLEQIGDMIERNSKGMTPEDMLDRAKSFVNHLQREDHMDNEGHQRNLRKFEADFHTNNAGPKENVHLSVRPSRFYSCSSSPCAWDPQNLTRSADGEEKGCISAKIWDEVGNDAAEFERQYTVDVQFSRTALPNPAEAAKRSIVYVSRSCQMVPTKPLLETCPRHFSSVADELPLEAYRQHASSGSDHVPLEACLLYVSSGTDQVPLEMCRQYA